MSLAPEKGDVSFDIIGLKVRNLEPAEVAVTITRNIHCALWTGSAAAK